MKLKLGDVFVCLAKDCKLVYLVLEVDEKNKEYGIFVLSHPYKSYVGERHTIDNSYEEEFILLEDANLNEF